MSMNAIHYSFHGFRRASNPQVLVTLVIVFALSITSCRRHVILTDLQRQHTSEARVVRLYIDRYGDLYPPLEVGVKNRGMNRPWRVKGTLNADTYSASLDFYFTGNYTTISNETAVDQRTDRAERQRVLSEYYGLIPIPSATALFDTVQSLIIQNTAKAIEDLEPTQVVVMVHGFNAPEPTGAFKELRERILKHTLDERIVFLEIYWDGLQAQINPLVQPIWSRAQLNSAYVAIGLRRVLNRLDRKTPIRIVTHSLGASVATGALFNCTSKWKDNAAHITDYQQLLKHTPAPQHVDLRLGMVVPAIPGETTFMDFNERGWSVAENGNNIQRMVVGHNCNDEAVTKRFMKSDHFAAGLGATTLGANYIYEGKPEFERTRQQMIDLGYADDIDGLLRQVAIRVHECGTAREDHGLLQYMERDSFDVFLGKLFDQP